MSVSYGLGKQVFKEEYGFGGGSRRGRANLIRSERWFAVFRVEGNRVGGESEVVVEARRVLRGAVVRLGVVLSAAGFVGVSWLVGRLPGWLAGHGQWAWAVAGAAVVALVGAVWSEGGEVLASARQVRELAGCQRCQVVMVELAEGHREVAGCEVARRRGLPLPGGHRGVA